jgi:hypothetical protein
MRDGHRLGDGNEAERRPVGLVVVSLSMIHFTLAVCSELSQSSGRPCIYK